MPSEQTRPPPTVRELEELAEAFRQSPRSKAFVPLAEAYLQLQRPREAVEALQRGLQAHPDLPEARLALGRAHAMLHQWSEAQGELLRAVKLDRQNRDAFRLLGEVLMRASDFERALQVLQHAHNLNPADPQVLGMLKRAREGRPLDPPPPIPVTKQQGSGPVRRNPFDAEPTTVASPQYVDAALSGDDAQIEVLANNGPTHVAPPPQRPKAPLPKPLPAPPAASRPPVSAPTRSLKPIAPAAPDRGDPTEIDEDQGAAALGRLPLERQRGRAAVEERQFRDDPRAEEGPRRSRPPIAPPPEDPFRPLTQDPPERLSTEDLAPTDENELPPSLQQRRPDAPRPEGGRPRLQHAPHKQQGEGADAMRRSAAVGEDYLNQLLVGGLLDVPNVEARPLPDDGTPVRRWGRSRLPIFILIWIFTLGGVGALGWYVVIPYLKQRAQHKVPADVPTKIARGTLRDFTDVETTLASTLAKDPSNEVAAASMAEAKALDFLVYGDGSMEDVETAIGATNLVFAKKKPTAPGQHELAVARAASVVAKALRAADAEAALRDARGQVDRELTAWPEDGVLRWLSGVVAAESGDRAAARDAFTKADAAGAGPPIARIALGDLKLDEGDAVGALADYENALTRAPHPMAVVGRALVRVEQKGDTEAAMQDLNVNLAEAKGARLEAWKHLALGAVYTRLEDYEKAKTEIDAAAAAGMSEPRFLARVALARLDQGQIGEALRLRTLIRGVADAKSRDPVGAVLVAELLLSAGLPADALDAIGDQRADVRARLARGRALLDAHDPTKAEKEFAAVLEASPGDLRAAAFRQLARVMAKQQAKDALEALQKLARASVSTTPRYVLGEAYVALGQPTDAKRELEASLEGNPLAYRARTRLADFYTAEARPADAEKALRAALDQAPGYAPAHGGLGKLLLAQGKPDEAFRELQVVIDSEQATAADELAYAEAAAGVGDKDTAKDAVRRAKIKNAPVADLSRVAALVDPALLTELGLPKPK